MKTKYLIVTNSKCGACLLFDRKGLGIYQTRTLRARFFSMGKNLVSATAIKTLQSLWHQIKNIINTQKPHLSLHSGQAH